MKIINIDQNTDEWFELRKGKITGSTLKDIVVKRGTKKKIGFYQLIADRIAQEPDDENVMDRGHRLEEEAIEKLEQQLGVKVERVGFLVSDFNPNIGLSPDGLIKRNGKYTEAVEVKCLNSARHIQALIEKELPKEYEEQALQYFIVNEDLQVLHFVFYDPRIKSNPYLKISITSDFFGDQIEAIKQYEIDTLKEIDQWVEKLAF